MKMENLREFLIFDMLVKDEEKLSYDFDEIFKNNEFLKLIKENVTKDTYSGATDNKQSNN